MAMERRFQVVDREPYLPDHLRIGVSTKAREEKEGEPKPKKVRGYQVPHLEVKRQEALKDLGKHYKHHPETTFKNRGEHFLTIWIREIIRKRPTITISSGVTLLGVDLKRLINEVVRDDDKVYVGDLKVIGREGNK
jgi:hypothetical protein